MAIPQPCLPDRKTYPACWATSLLHPVGLGGVAGSVIHAGFLDWAGGLTQLRDLERAPTIRRGVITSTSSSSSADNKHARAARRRRTPRHVRRLFIWGFIGVNAAVTAAWARAADDAVSAGPNSASVLSLLFRLGGGGGGDPHGLRRSPLMGFMVENMALLRCNPREGRWWTLLTCGVSHAELGHLLVNMGEFYVWASRCFDLGVGAGGVAGLMAGSGVCCGLAGVLGEDARRPGLYLGASGIVCGLSEFVPLFTYSFSMQEITLPSAGSPFHGGQRRRP